MNGFSKHYHLGRSAMDSKDYRMAIEQFSIYIDNYPSDYYAFLLRGQSKFKIASFEEDFDDAITDFSNSIHLRENNFEAYYHRGLAYLRINVYHAYRLAIEDFTMAIKLNPRIHDFHLHRGVAYFKNNQFAEALIDMNEFLERCPSKVSRLEGYENRVIVFNKIKEYENAVKDYTMILEFPPNRKSSTYFQRGRAYFSLGNYREAINDYNSALELDPKNIEASFNLSLVKEIIDFKNVKGERALGDFIRSLYELLDDSSEIVEIIEIDKMDCEARECIRIYPRFYLGYVFRAIVHENKKEYESAKKDLEISLSLKPENEISLHLMKAILNE